MNTSIITSETTMTSSNIPFSIRIILAVFMFLMILGSVVGNIFTVIAVIRVRSLQTLASVFVVNLAVADCLAGITCLPFTLASAITDRWTFGSAFCKIHGFLNGTFAATSMLTLGVVAIERYYAICQPFLYNERMTSNVAVIMVAFTWIYSILVASMPLFEFWSHYKYWRIEYLCTVAWNYDKYFTTFYIVTCFSIPIAVLMFTYFQIFKVAVRQRRAVAAANQFQLKHQQKIDIFRALPEAKVALIIFIVIGTFLACWLPHVVGMICLAYVHHCPISEWFFAISTWLALLNSGCNPVIYGIMNKQFREAYKSIISQVRRREAIPLITRLSKAEELLGNSRTKRITIFTLFKKPSETNA